MIFTLLDVISRATTLAGGRRDWAPSEVSFYANLAASEVFEQAYHTPLEALAISSTTSGENRIALPADFQAVLGLSNLSTAVTPRTLLARDATWVDSQVTQSGSPTHYALFGSWLELYPTPDSAESLQLRYYARQPEMTDSASTPVFHERWHPGWLYKTAEHLELSRTNPEGAAIWGQKYVSYMGSILDDKARRQSDKRSMGLRYQRDAE